jgi:hypothetical protein
MSHYRQVIIETFKNIGNSSSKSVRARPISGQGLNVTMKVECSSKMRKDHPVGTLFLLEAKVTDREGGTPFLYAHYNSPYKVVSKNEAAELLSHIN